MGKPHGAINGLVQHLDFVVFFKRHHHGTQHADALGLVGLLYFHDLKAAGEGGILLDVTLVFVPGGGGDGAEGAAGEGGFEQIGGITGTAATSAHERVGFVNEQDDGLGRGLDFINHTAQALLEFAFHARARLKQAHVQRADAHILERRGHITRKNALHEAFDDGGLADAGFARQDGIILPAAHEDVHALPDFLITTDDGINFSFARLFRQVNGEPFQRLLFAHRGRGHRVAGFAGRGVAAHAFLDGESLLRRTAANFSKLIGQRLQLDFRKLFGDPIGQHAAKTGSLEDADEDVPDAHAPFAKQERAVDPRPLDGFLQMRRKVGDGRGPARQPVQRGGDVGGEPAGVNAEMPGDAVQVGVRELRDLVNPVDQLDVGIAAQLAEDGGVLDGFVADAVQLAEECSAFDFSHVMRGVSGSGKYSVRGKDDVVDGVVGG